MHKSHDEFLERDEEDIQINEINEEKEYERTKEQLHKLLSKKLYSKDVISKKYITATTENFEKLTGETKNRLDDFKTLGVKKRKRKGGIVGNDSGNKKDSTESSRKKKKYKK